MQTVVGVEVRPELVVQFSTLRSKPTAGEQRDNSARLIDGYENVVGAILLDTNFMITGALPIALFGNDESTYSTRTKVRVQSAFALHTAG
jgi:hypothetical protein